MKMFDNYHDQGEKAIIRNVIIPATWVETLTCRLYARYLAITKIPRLRGTATHGASSPVTSKGYLYRVASRFKNTGATLEKRSSRSFSITSGHGETTKVSFGKPKTGH